MALWGISTTQETAANNYALPKFFNEQDRDNSTHNCFADERGWIFRHYKSTEYSGLSTQYWDEVIVPVAGLNTTGYGATTQNVTGLGTATPVAIFFEDPNLASPISVGGGGTTGITTGATGYVHLVYNECVFCGAGATIKLRTFDVNNENESDPIIGYANSVTYGAPIVAYANTTGITEYTNFNGQITNRVAFAFTAPGTVLSADLIFNTTSIASTVAVGGTLIYVADLTGVSAASSITVDTNDGVQITNAPLVAVGTTQVEIGAGSTAGNELGVGATVTFSNLTNQTQIKIDIESGVVGVITSLYGDAATKVFRGTSAGIDRNIGGAGSYGSGVGIGTTALSVTA